LLVNYNKTVNYTSITRQLLFNSILSILHIKKRQIHVKYILSILSCQRRDRYTQIYSPSSDMSRSEIPKSQISTCTKSDRRRLLRARTRTASCGSITTAVAVRRRGWRLLRLLHRPHPPTYISNQFSMSRYQGDSRYAGIGDHGYSSNGRETADR
jgi:hypothetical protein